MNLSLYLAWNLLKWGQARKAFIALRIGLKELLFPDKKLRAEIQKTVNEGFAMGLSGRQVGEKLDKEVFHFDV